MDPITMQADVVKRLNYINLAMLRNRFPMAVAEGTGLTTDIASPEKGGQAFAVRMGELVLLCAPEFRFRRPMSEMGPAETPEEWNANRTRIGPLYLIEERGEKEGEGQQFGRFEDRDKAIGCLFSILVERLMKRLLKEMEIAKTMNHLVERCGEPMDMASVAEALDRRHKAAVNEQEHGATPYMLVPVNGNREELAVYVTRDGKPTLTGSVRHVEHYKITLDGTTIQCGEGWLAAVPGEVSPDHYSDRSTNDGGKVTAIRQVIKAFERLEGRK